jgi:hypothetical protein
MSSRVTHYSLFWAAPPLLPPLSLTSLDRRPWQIPDLGLDNDPSSLHCNPFSFGRRLLDLRYRPDEPSRAAEGAGGRRRRRGGEAPAARPRWHAAHASGMRPAAVCTSASSGPAPCGCPSSPALWALVCATFARSDAPLCRLRARLVPFVSGWACRECTARTSNLLPLCVRKVAQTIVIMMNTYDSTCAVRDDKNSVRYRRQLRVRTVRTARMASTVSRRRGRARRPIGPIATDLTQPCGQTMTYITDTPGHTIATTTRSTRRARCSADRAQNAPRPEPTTHRKAVNTTPLRGSTQQRTTALIRAGRGADWVTVSLHTRAKSALWNSRGGASRRQEDPMRGRRPLVDVHVLQSGARVRSLIRLEPGTPRPVTCGTRESTTAAR